MKYLTFVRLLLVLTVVMAVGAQCVVPTATEAPPAEEEEMEAAPSGEVIEITLWHQESPPRRVESLQELIDQFNEEHPNIKVTQAPQSWSEIYPKLYAAIEADNPPDVAFSIPDLSMAMKLTGALQPVDDIVEEVDSKYDLLDSQMTPYYYDDHYWSVPMWGMTHLLYYNKGMFEDAGISAPFESWDELLAASQALTKDGKFGGAIPASQQMFTDQNLYNFMVTNNCEIFDAEGNVTLDSPQCIETFEFYNELLKTSPPDAISWNWGDSEHTFVAENTGMIMLFPSYAQWMEAEEEGKGPFGAMRIPLPEGGKQGSVSYSNGAMVFAKDPERYAAVKEFLMYLHDPEINGAWLADWEPGVFLPITDAAAKSDGFWSHPAIDHYKEDVQLEVDATADGKLFGFEYEPVPVVGRVAGENLLAQAVGKMAIGEMTPEEVVRWAADTIREWQSE